MVTGREGPGRLGPIPTVSAAVAAIYFVFGVTWIVVTDAVVLTLVDDPVRASNLQTAKGWIFVGLSGVLIFGLVWYGHRTIHRTTERLDRALRETSILHRHLRHNLRNVCNVVSGHADLLDEELRDQELSERQHERLDTIREEIDQLADISDRTRFLRSVILDDTEGWPPNDLVRQIESTVEHRREVHPEATFETDLPDDREIPADPRVERGIDELLENAVVHSDRPDPTVRVGLRENPAGPTVFVADHGPGMPDMERDVLEEGIERPMFHSEGLGLWIARTVVDNAGGTFRITDNEPRGTIVSFELPRDPIS